MLRNTSFGALMQLRRKALRLTQQDVADRTGLSVSYIGQIEQEKKIPPLPTAIAIAQALSLEGMERKQFLDARAGTVSLPQTARERALRQLRTLFEVTVGRQRTVRSVTLVAMTSAILLASMLGGLLYLLTMRAASGNIQNALLRPSIPPCIEQATPPSVEGTAPLGATWQLVYPSTTQCSQTAQGMRLTYRRDAAHPQISDVEYDLVDVGGLSYSEQNSAISVQASFEDPRSVSTWAGLIFLTPVSLPQGGLYQYGGYLFLINPGLHTWKLTLVGANGFPSWSDGGKLPRGINVARPVTLMVKLLDDTIVLFANGEQVHAPYPINASVRTSLERVAGVFLSCPEANISSPVDVRQFAIYHLHP